MWSDEDWVVVEEMTRQGESAAAIASVIGSTAKSVAKLRADRHIFAADGCCRHCGEPVAYEGRGRRPTYCSETCRNAYRKSQAPAPEERECGHCRGVMTSPRRRYCSRRCSQSAWYHRARDDESVIARRRLAVLRYQAVNRVAKRILDADQDQIEAVD